MLLVSIAVLASSCFPFVSQIEVEGLWQGTGEGIYSIQVWEDNDLILEDTWEGGVELTLEVISATSGNVHGNWYWRDLTQGTQFAEPSPPLPFIGTLVEELLSLQTDDEQSLPAPTQYNAEFGFEMTGDHLTGAGTYSEEGSSPDVRILFDLVIEEITLSRL